MIVTTTETIQGEVIDQYLGIVTGMDNYLVGGVFGEGAGKKYGGLYNSGAFEEARKMMEEKAASLHADAVVGVQMCTAIGTGTGGCMYVQLMGTAVTLKGAAPKTGALEQPMSDKDTSRPKPSNSSPAKKRDEKWICPNCGSSNDPHALYCKDCGEYR